MDNGRKCEIRPVDFGSLKALVSVRIGAMEIRGFKVIDQGDGKPWVAMPSREIVRDGRREYYDIVRFGEKAAKEEFTDWVVGEYRKAVETAS
jgi:DNA-binding cell septation regulator SpoVG